MSLTVANSSCPGKNRKDLWEMEFVERQFPTDAIPIGAIVTASGTGARNEWRARSLQTKKKKLKTGMLALAPRFAVLDPAYTLSVPRMQVISGAFDTLSHAMETYFGKFGSGQRVRRFGVGRYANTVVNMHRLLINMSDLEARGNLMWDSAMAENGVLKVGRFYRFSGASDRTSAWRLHGL